MPKIKKFFYLLYRKSAAAFFAERGGTALASGTSDLGLSFFRDCVVIIHHSATGHVIVEGIPGISIHHSTRICKMEYPTWMQE